MHEKVNINIDFNVLLIIRSCLLLPILYMNIRNEYNQRRQTWQNNLKNSHLISGFLEDLKNHHHREITETLAQLLEAPSQQLKTLLETELRELLNNKITQIEKTQKKDRERMDDWYDKYYWILHKIDERQTKNFSQYQDRKHFIPIPNQFPERKQEAMQRNDPLDIVQLTF